MDDATRSDENIVKEILTGDSERFGLLMQRYEEKLKRYGRRFLSSPEGIEDVVQEVFINTYQNLNSFNTSRRFSPWIYRIAHNAFVNALKKHQRDPLPFFDSDVLFPHPIAKERPDADMEQTDIKHMLDVALADLPAKYREPLVLFYLEGFDYASISNIMHLPVSTVGVRISRGRKLLKEIFIKKGYK
jgi:RNA polymerase sigma-70 factor (ECF subfamily)